MQAGTPPRVVVPYRIFSPFLTVVVVTGVVLTAAVVAWIALLVGHSVSIECSRTARTCAVSTTYPLLGSFVQSRPLGELGAPQVTSPGVQGNAGAITFKTFYGAWYAGDCPTADDCARAKTALDAFLAKPEMASVSVPLVQPASPAAVAVVALVGAALVAFLAFLGLSAVQRAEVHVDPATRTLTVQRRRWFLRAYSRALPASQIRGTIVRDQMRVARGIRRPFYTTALELTNGERIDVLDRWSPSREPHDRAARQIDAYLAAFAGAGPWPPVPP